MASAMTVFYDLETGNSFPNHSDILEIGAVSSYGATFQTYVTPTQPIAPGASAVNKMTTDGQGNLYVNGAWVRTVPLQQALAAFISFLDGLGAPCLLVAHNGHNFDHLFLANAVKKIFPRRDFSRVVFGCSDTIPIFKRILGRNNVGLGELARDYLNQHQTHGALSDAHQLKQVTECLRVSKDDLVAEALRYF